MRICCSNRRGQEKCFAVAITPSALRALGKRRQRKNDLRQLDLRHMTT